MVKFSKLLLFKNKKSCITNSLHKLILSTPSWEFPWIFLRANFCGFW